MILTHLVEEGCWLEGEKDYNRFTCLSVCVNASIKVFMHTNACKNISYIIKKILSFPVRNTFAHAIKDEQDFIHGSYKSQSLYLCV